MSKPTHKAYVVNEAKDGSTYWREIGAVWPHKKGNGFDITIFEGISFCATVDSTGPGAGTLARRPAGMSGLPARPALQ
jgi:hypothetical protein